MEPNTATDYPFQKNFAADFFSFNNLNPDFHRDLLVGPHVKYLKNKVNRAPDRPVQEIEHHWIEMPDGVRLVARLGLPEDNPCPAILEYIPCRKRDMVRPRDARTHPVFAAQGFACLRVDMRGSGDSEGVIPDMYHPNELSDARHVLNWIAAQPWCTGRAGMFGTSWGGTTSLQAAVDAPGPLKAVIANCATIDRFEDDIHWMGGALLTDSLEWRATLETRAGGWLACDTTTAVGEKVLALTADGLGAAGDTDETRRVPFDPAHGQAAGDTGYFGRPGGLALDQAEEVARSLCFDTVALETELDLFGHASLEVTVLPGATDGQLVCRICDLAPDGRVLLVTRLVRVVALDDTLDRDLSETPDADAPRRLRLEFPATAYRFAKGHRLRLAPGVSYWPLAWPSGAAEP